VSYQIIVLTKELIEVVIQVCKTIVKSVQPL